MMESSLAEGTTVSSLLDSGSNVHMKSRLDDLSGRKSFSKECSFGNNPQIQPNVSGTTKLLVQEKCKAVEMKIKDLLWVTKLRYR